MLYFIQRHPRLAGSIAAAAVIVAFWMYWSGRINTWDLVNAPPATDEPIACFGDSLVHGVGADSEDSTYPALLAEMLDAVVVVHGYSGATTGTALQTLRESLEIDGSIVIVTLGGNDFMRRMSLAETLENLEAIFTELQRRGAMVAYTGVPDGRTDAYRELCRKKGVLLIPEVLDGILGNRDLKANPIHPNSKGYRVMAERVAETLKKHVLKD